LPEAQLDRFLFKIHVPYPALEEEVLILQHHHTMLDGVALDQVSPILNASQIAGLQQVIRSIHVEEKLMTYIATLIQETRSHKSIFLGASPRASVAVLNASKAIAGMHGRDFVTPDDIVYVLHPVLRHRIVLTPEKEMEGVSPDEVIRQMIRNIEIPR